MNIIPDEIDDMRYCVLDAQHVQTVDFYWLPLVFLESFHAPAVCLEIGSYSMQMPMDWSIMICDDDFSAVEMIPLSSLNNRGFKAVTLNPLMSNTLDALDISITNIYQDVKWYFPKLKNGHILVVPLEDGEKPKCAYFVKDVNKLCDIELADLF